MLDLEIFIKNVRAYNPNCDQDRLRQAYQVAGEAHGEQLRKSGEPYMIHPLEVANLLTRLRMDDTTLMAALLHDVVEDTHKSLVDVRNEFGAEVSEIVDGVTKLSKISFTSRQQHQAENFRKMIISMSKDIRVILIKLADRLHNMRTLQFMANEKQIEIAQETLDIYAPLSNRLGIEWMKIELEDLSMRYLKPEIYYKLVEQIAKERRAREEYISNMEKEIISYLKSHQYTDFEIKGRPKHFYSIYRKMEARNLSFEEIHDVLGFRIITHTIPACYEALGLLHARWKPVPGRFKDYIALPKANMYQSLHTTIIGPEGERVEIQIRTEEMNHVAEEGVAAHWMYKDKGNIDPQAVSKFGWIRRMVDVQQDLKDSGEFMDSLRVDLFEDEVYVFTPRGDIKAFPKGSTPVDFAYDVHSDVGASCVGAKVNGRIVPLKYKLKNGDTLQIITKDNQRPKKHWLEFVKTSKARNKIRAYIKKEQRERSRQIGEELLEREFRRVGQNFQKLLKKGALDKLYSDFRVANIEELIINVGYGKIPPTEISRALLPEDVSLPKSAKIPLVEQIVERVARKRSSPVQIQGVDDILIRFGRCCNPVPGDQIVGFVTRGRGITVHTADCPKGLTYDEERRVDVRWGKDANTEYSIKISVISQDIPGILAEITKTISHLGGNITNANIRTTKDKKAVNVFQISIKDLGQLHLMLNRIEKIPGVMSAERVTL